MKKHYRSFLKLDVFGIGPAVGGVATATAQIIAAEKAAGATKYAADQSYQGAVATNNANIQMANDLNATNIQNTRETNATNIQLNNQTNAANRALAEQQNQWNLEQWNRTNEYNSPANQVKLYREAGLNPATLAGSGWSDAQQLTSAPLANQVAPQIQAPQASALPALINPAADAANIQLQGALQRSQLIAGIGKSAADVAESFARTRKTQAETGQIETYTPLEAKKRQKEIDLLTKQDNWYNKLSNAEWRKKLHEVTVLRNTASLLNSEKRKNIVDAKLAEFDLGIKNKCREIFEEMPRVTLQNLYMQAKSYGAAAVASNAAALASKAAASASEASARYSDALTTKTGKESDILDWEYNQGHRMPSPSGGVDQLLTEIITYCKKNGLDKAIDDIVDIAGDVIKKGGKKVIDKAADEIPEFGRVRDSYNSYRNINSFWLNLP